MKSREYYKTQVIAHFVCLFFFLCALLPFLLLVISSFTDNRWASVNGFSFFPGKWSLEAYYYIWRKWGLIGTSYMMTLIVTAIGTFISVLMTAMFAYGISKSNIRGMKIIRLMLVFTMLFNGGIVSTYYCYVKIWGIKDSIWALIFPSLLMNAFNVILVRNYFVSSIPASLEEAARIDGAGTFRIFSSIVFPLSKPIIATIGLMSGLGYWNDEAFKNDYVLYFKEGNLHGFTDAKGNILAPAIYQDFYQFVDNVAAVTKDNKSGYINTKGKIIIPLQYDEAYDVFTIYYGEQVDYKFQHETNVAIVGQDNRYGLTVIPDHELIIPIEYDELEWLIHNLFNAKKGDNYYLINHRNELLISSLSDSPFRYENHFLLFTKLQGSSKCKIFNLDGVYLGDYNTKKIEELPHRHYYVGPSKWQVKQHY